VTWLEQFAVDSFSRITSSYSADVGCRWLVITHLVENSRPAAVEFWVYQQTVGHGSQTR